MQRYGVQILWTARYDYDKGRRLRPHNHAFYQFIWAAEGRGVFQCGEEVYPLEAGTLYCLQPGVIHGLTADRSTKVKTLDIKFEIVSSELEQAASRLPSRIPQVSGDIIQLLDRIRREGAQQQPYYRELASLHLVEILYRLSRAAYEASPENQRSGHTVIPGPYTLPTEGSYAAAKQIEEWIKQHALETWTIAEMASQLGYSGHHLQQLFKKYRGCTIAGYQREIRIVRSKEWMAYSDYTLKQIAEKAGFKTVQHFSRMFKQLEGETPGAWLAREKRGIRKDIIFPS
ncbi:AraC family transcriptional regulator [Paenibacillus silviterrae]|uniref:AraC family transcriptional regulator n=1 Tax=Paenibacillus silviterrae TaxID=3242194 RepID=UPI0025439759|nr:AraC family transcriptional regulator [Paenibacillus chinjuensis]